MSASGGLHLAAHSAECVGRRASSRSWLASPGEYVAGALQYGRTALCRQAVAQQPWRDISHAMPVFPGPVHLADRYFAGVAGFQVSLSPSGEVALAV